MIIDTLDLLGDDESVTDTDETGLDTQLTADATSPQDYAEPADFDEADNTDLEDEPDAEPEIQAQPTLTPADHFASAMQAITDPSHVAYSDNVDEATGVPTRKALMAVSVPFSQLQLDRKARILAALTGQVISFMERGDGILARTTIEVQRYLNELGTQRVEDPAAVRLRNEVAVRLAPTVLRQWLSLRDDFQINAEMIGDAPAEYVIADETQKAQSALTDYLYARADNLAYPEDSADSQKASPDTLPAAAQLALRMIAANFDPSVVPAGKTGQPSKTSTSKTSTSKTSTSKTSTSKTGQPGTSHNTGQARVNRAGQSRGSVDSHLAEVFLGLPAGTEMTFGEIAKIQTDAYPAGNVSPGAVGAVANNSARLENLSLEQATVHGRKGYRKI